MLTRKHFTELANAIKQAHGDINGGWNPTEALDMLAERVADMCKDENPRFDRMRFLAACQPVINCRECESRLDRGVSDCPHCGTANADM